MSLETHLLVCFSQFLRMRKLRFLLLAVVAFVSSALWLSALTTAVAIPAVAVAEAEAEAEASEPVVVVVVVVSRCPPSS